MRKIIAIMVLGLFAMGTAHAGAEKVAFPEGYQTHFVRYTTVDKPKRKTVRFMYVNPESLAKAKANQPAPHGTVLIIEDHKAKLDAAGNPVTDARGRFIPTSEITNIFVQEKQPGWGAEYPAAKRNGEWEYSWFNAKGVLRTEAFVKFDNCFACHKENAEFDDYTFTFATFLGAINK